MNNTNKIRESYLLVAISAACWGMMAILTRKLEELGFDSISISALRPTVAVLFYVLFTLIKNPKCFKTDLKGILFFIVYGVIALDGMFLSFTYAVKYTSIATASVLLFTNPIFVMIMSYFVFKEKFTLKKVLSLLLAILGCFLISRGYDSQAFKIDNLFGIGMGVLSGFTVALQNVLGKIGGKKYPPKTLLVYSFIFATIFLWFFRSPISLIQHTNNLTALFYVIAIGFVATVIPNGLFVKALQHVESSKASIVCSIEPIIAAILGYVIYKEVLEIPQVIGMVLILFSVVLIQLKDKKTKDYMNETAEYPKAS
ncbi:DMT family transporter [Clostridium ganghwense]|uniref:DMT family transporter n=1 Tax=Clostridium ganghwense TaxID=312089 RepID=A0ABT4CPR8_9CLOT|nr:DMT family transporter [Clostridium ganghwense]MCY6371040.1 DMT family transporter [Clostridium ganghwense]